VEIDNKITQKLLDADDNYSFNPAVHRGEHSVEVNIPFIQHLFPKAKIVAVVMGTSDLKQCTRFGETLAEIVKDHRTLIVASSDLSHYPDYDDAVVVDNKVLDAIVSMNPKKVQTTINQQMRKGMRNLSTCACGEGPILTVMAAAKAMGVEQAVKISYANSGDALIGDASRVVGYGAVVFGNLNNSPNLSEGNKQTGESLNKTDQKMLLSLARETIHRYLTTETVPLPRGFSPSAQNHQGAFVTLHKHNNLRGCIGHMAEDTPLYRVVGKMALQAAFNDRRFKPVTLDELDDIEIEISVLTPFKLVPCADDIVIGRDGVRLEKNGRSAVYLPQVAPEQGWTLEETLDHLCQKAGLPASGWKRGAKLYTFQAEVFCE